MSGVVWRCPKCGTTQSHSGECEACYDGQVRYFCSEHTPGLWLDEPICKECGAKFGETLRRPPARRPPAPPPPAAPPPPKTRRPEVRRPMPRDAEPRLTGPRGGPDPEVTPTKPSLEDLLARMFSARRGHTGYEESRWGEPEPEVRLRRSVLGGCLLRILLFALVLLALAVGGTFLLFGGALHYLLSDSSHSARLLPASPEQMTRGKS